jgi:hypothetical protein
MMKNLRIIIIVILTLGGIILFYWAVQPEISPEWTGFGTIQRKNRPDQI